MRDRDFFVFVEKADLVFADDVLAPDGDDIDLMIENFRDLLSRSDGESFLLR